MSKLGTPTRGDDHRTIADLERRLKTMERLMGGDLLATDQTLATARAMQMQGGGTSSLIACSYDPMMCSIQVNATNNRLALAAMYVTRTVAVNNVFAGLVAGATQVAAGNFNGTCLYKYDTSTGVQRLVLLGRSSASLVNNQGNVSLGGFLGALIKGNSDPTTYGLAGFNSISGLSTDWILTPGLYYAGHGFSGTGGTTTQYIQGANNGSTSIQNMEWDADAYPFARFGAYIMGTDTVPPDVLLKAQVGKVSNVPWMALIA